jgi:hypothetical protein
MKPGWAGSWMALTAWARAAWRLVFSKPSAFPDQKKFRLPRHRHAGRLVKSPGYLDAVILTTSCHEGQEVAAALGVEAVDGLDQAEGGDLLEVVEVIPW